LNEDVNSNKMRAKTLVELFPGIHLRKLQRLLGTSFSTTRYHVDHLLREGEIVSERERGYTRLYPSGFEQGDRRIYAGLQNKSARSILHALISSRLLGKAELAEATQLSRSTIATQLEVLELLNLVEELESHGGQPAYRIIDGGRVALILSALEKNPLSVATDNFIDLWGDL